MQQADIDRTLTSGFDAELGALSDAEIATEIRGVADQLNAMLSWHEALKAEQRIRSYCPREPRLEAELI